MKTGLFGGTFNPIHHGHLFIAEYCRCGLDLDRILFIPAGNPPHKSSQDLADASDRFEMAKLAIQDDPRFLVLDYEIQKKEIGYTVETLKWIQKDSTFKSDALYLIIGADSLLELDTWKSPLEILNMMPCAVYQRPGFPVEKARQEYLEKVQILDVPLIGISSSEIRERIRQNQSVRYWLPEIVQIYIHQKGLYL